MYSAVLSYSVPEHFSPQSILVNNIIYFWGKIENDEGDEYSVQIPGEPADTLSKEALQEFRKKSRN